MSWYDNILKFLGLRKRSAPNSKTLWLYLFAVISPEMFAYYARDYILVLLCIGTLFDRKISFFFIPYLFYKIYTKSEEYNEENGIGDVRNAIYCLQTHHIESLKTILSENPELLTMKYKKQDLIYWAKYYKDIEGEKYIL